MQHDPQLEADIKGAERLKLVAYRDTKKLWTVGWGHLLDRSRDWTGYTVTKAWADMTFDSDLACAVAQASRLLEWSLLNRCRTNALYELVFNMGLSTWMDFKKCRFALANREWETAAAELVNSDWYTQVHPTRGDRLANYLRVGSYPSAVASFLSPSRALT